MNTIFEPAGVMQMKRDGVPAGMLCPPIRCGQTRHQRSAAFGLDCNDAGGPPAPLMRGAWSRMADVEVMHFLVRLEGLAGWPGADRSPLEVRTCTGGWRMPLGWSAAELVQLEFELGAREARIDAVAEGSRAWLLTCGRGLLALRSLAAVDMQRLQGGHAARRHFVHVLKLDRAARRDGLGPHRVVECADDLRAMGVSPSGLLSRAVRPVRLLNAPSELRGQGVRLEAAVLHGGGLYRGVFLLSGGATVTEESLSLVASDVAAPEHCVRCWRSTGPWSDFPGSGLVVPPDMGDHHPQFPLGAAAYQRQVPPAVKRCQKEEAMTGR